MEGYLKFIKTEDEIVSCKNITTMSICKNMGKGLVFEIKIMDGSFITIPIKKTYDIKRSEILDIIFYNLMLSMHFYKITSEIIDELLKKEIKKEA